MFYLVLFKQNSTIVFIIGFHKTKTRVLWALYLEKKTEPSVWNLSF